jgi:dihydrofolate reductase
MGRIVSIFFISLDGVVESPREWHFPYFDDEMGAIVDQGVASSTAFLMGRKLYDEWSSYWPGQPPEEPFALRPLGPSHSGRLRSAAVRGTDHLPAPPAT